MRSLRLYQLGLQVVDLDENLAYSMLVAAIESISVISKAKTKIAEKEKVMNALDLVLSKFDIEKGQIEYLQEQLVKGLSLQKRFTGFIRDNLPTSFWDGDYSLTTETHKQAEYEWSGQSDRDKATLEENPERKKELLSVAEKKKREWKKLLESQPYAGETPFIKKEDVTRKWTIQYMRNNLEVILETTYDCRSRMLHKGQNFPKIALEEESFDWIPKIFDVFPQGKFEEHWTHKFSYVLDNKKRLILKCDDCGKEIIKIIVMFNLRVFERLVHDTIFNALGKMKKAI